MTQVTRSQERSLFDDLMEFHYDDAEMNHRKGSSFYRSIVVCFTEDDAEWFPKIKDFEKYVGYWKTNTFLWSESDWDRNEIDTLTKVEKVVVESYEWKEV